VSLASTVRLGGAICGLRLESGEIIRPEILGVGPGILISRAKFVGWRWSKRSTHSFLLPAHAYMTNHTILSHKRISGLIHFGLKHMLDALRLLYTSSILFLLSSLTFMVTFDRPFYLFILKIIIYFIIIYFITK
jgi:hypothetical protein